MVFTVGLCLWPSSLGRKSVQKSNYNNGPWKRSQSCLTFFGLSSFVPNYPFSTLSKWSFDKQRVTSAKELGRDQLKIVIQSPVNVLLKLFEMVVVVAQLVEWSLPTSEVCSSNPVSGNSYLLSALLRRRKLKKCLKIPKRKIPMLSHLKRISLTWGHKTVIERDGMFQFRKPQRYKQ